MNNLQLFNFEGNEVRTLKIDDEPYFVGKDVTKILGYKNSSKALSDHVDEEDKLNNETLSSLGQRGGWLVNESGLYSLILSSKMPNAKRFKHWEEYWEYLSDKRKKRLYGIDIQVEEVKKMNKYGKTKLDHFLSYFAMAFEKIFEFMSILLIPLLVIQQTVIYGEHHPEQVLPVLMGLMIVIVVVGTYVLTRKKQEEI